MDIKINGWKLNTKTESETESTVSVIVSVLIKVLNSMMLDCHSSGAVWESRWTSWAVRPNKPSGFRGRKDLLNSASALVTTCP